MRWRRRRYAGLYPWERYEHSSGRILALLLSGKEVGLLSFNGSCIRVSDHAMVPFYNVRVWLVVINPLVLVLQSLSLGDMRR